MLWIIVYIFSLEKRYTLVFLKLDMRIALKSLIPLTSDDLVTDMVPQRICRIGDKRFPFFMYSGSWWSHVVLGVINHGVFHFI